VPNDFVVGCSTDYKPRIYSRYTVGVDVAVSATADIVEGRLSLYVAEYTVSTNRVRLVVDGVERVNKTTLGVPSFVDRRLQFGAAVNPSNDPSGFTVGKLAFAGGMTGVDSSFEPLIRTFAKERFPTGLAHAA
jgi:hypothetical protein